jgi:hypothetical protein
MHDPIPLPIRRDPWEARLDHYDGALLTYLEWIERTRSSIEVDGFSEAAEHLAKALLAIEDAWSVVALEKSSSMIASNVSPRP